MVSFNVYKSTSSGTYVEGVCLATDEKPVVGIANGSILFAVDASDGSTTRYMYDQPSMSWIEAACPCSGGSGGSGGGDSGGGDSGGGDSGSGAAPLLVHSTTSLLGTVLDTDFNTVRVAIEAGRCVFYEASGDSADDEINGFFWHPLSELRYEVVETIGYYTVSFVADEGSWLVFTGTDPTNLVMPRV